MAIPEFRSFTLEGNTEPTSFGGITSFTLDGEAIDDHGIVDWLTRCGYTYGDSQRLVNLLWDGATLTLPIYEGSDVWFNLSLDLPVK